MPIVNNVADCPSLRRRSLAEAGLDGAALEEFKRDGRSAVWRVERSAERGGGAFAVKQFVFAPLRQRLSMLVGMHPAQIELRWNRRLQQAFVRVVPILDVGIERAGMGCRVWLATPITGVSMQTLIRVEATRRARGEELIEAAARLATVLFMGGFWSRDLKPSNIVIDDFGQALLIDVGSVRSGANPTTIARTLAVTDRVLARDGVEEPLRLQFKKRVAEMYMAVSKIRHAV